MNAVCSVSVQCINVVGDYLYSGLGDGIVMRVSLSNHQERLQWRSGFTTVSSLAVRGMDCVMLYLLPLKLRYSHLIAHRSVVSGQ